MALSESTTENFGNANRKMANPNYPDMAGREAPDQGGHTDATYVASESDALLAKALYKIEIQRLRLRWIAFAVALFAIIGIATLGYYIIHCVIHAETRGDELIYLAIALVTSFTLLVISTLVGVFRGSHERDAGGLPIKTVVRSITGNGS